MANIPMLMLLGHLASAEVPSAPSTVYTHGEGGFPCIRIPSTLHIAGSSTAAAANRNESAEENDGVLLSFAAARSWTGDSCFPTAKTLPGRKAYSAHVVKRSTDSGQSWSPMREIGRTETGAAPSYRNPSPEGCSLYHTASQTAITIFSANVSNTTTGLRIWQSNSGDAGQTWSAPAPLNIPQLRESNVTTETHISPGNGIELRSGPHKGRLLNVLILIAGNVLDVVIYSDDGGRSWQLGATQLPHNGEAALAEVDLNGNTGIVFNGRSRRHGYPRGIAWSYDDGATFQKLRFAIDRSAGISCLASLLSDPFNRSALLFSHPNGSAHGSRSDGVVLRSTDAAESWQVAEWVHHDSAASTSPMFAYSNLNEMVGGVVGLTYETGDPGCEITASACRIIFRALSPSKTDDNIAAAPPLLRAVTASDAGFGQHDNGSIVIGHDKAGPLNITGIEGSFYTRTTDGKYHFLSGGEMPAPAGMDYYETDIHMRFDHWQSSDGVTNWTWTSKIFESSGVFDGTDRRGSTCPVGRRVGWGAGRRVQGFMV